MFFVLNIGRGDLDCVYGCGGFDWNWEHVGQFLWEVFGQRDHLTYVLFLCNGNKFRACGSGLWFAGYASLTSCFQFLSVRVCYSASGRLPICLTYWSPLSIRWSNSFRILHGFSNRFVFFGTNFFPKEALQTSSVPFHLFFHTDVRYIQYDIQEIFIVLVHVFHLFQFAQLIASGFFFVHYSELSLHTIK